MSTGETSILSSVAAVCDRRSAHLPFRQCAAIIDTPLQQRLWRLQFRSSPYHERMIDVVKASEAEPRKSFDVAFDLLAIGPQSMIAKMHYRPENHIPFHSHPNEQSGYIISGRTRVVTRDASYELGPGDSYVIPADVEHSIEVIEPTEELQVFTPPREDFR
jgi:quercetin dioxygenase-like cupin family protein